MTKASTLLLAEMKRLGSSVLASYLCCSRQEECLSDDCQQLWGNHTSYTCMWCIKCAWDTLAQRLAGTVWGNAQQLRFFSPKWGGYMQAAHGQCPVLAPRLCLGIVQESTTWPEPKVGPGPFQWFDANRHFAGIIQPATGMFLCQSLSESFR